MDQYGLGPATESPFGASAPAANPYARRIEPTPPPQRSKLLLGLAIGLVAGLLVFGGAGFLTGRGTAGGTTAGGSPSPEPSAVASLKAANQTKFAGELSALAAPWLSDLSDCTADTDPNGPKLGQGEQKHVLCRDGGLYVHFVTYTSVDEKNSDRSYRQQLALGTAAILTGSEPPGRKLGGVTAKPGSYVEYATRGAKTPALCGIWWDLDNTSSAVYSDVLCDSLGGTWDPLRAVWRLHS
jgi:hypothetical protein